MMNGDDVLNLGGIFAYARSHRQGDEEWMKQREERGRLGTALLQPMAIYEVRVDGKNGDGLKPWVCFSGGCSHF